MRKDRKKTWPYILDLFFVGLFCSAGIALVYLYVANEFDSFVEMGNGGSIELSRSCPRNEVTRVKIGAIAYAFPTGKILESFSGFPNRPPCLNGASLSSITLVVPFPDQPAEKTPPAQVQISLIHVPSPHKLEDTYARFIKNGRTEKLVLVKTLPIEEGYYVGLLSKYQGLFILADPEIRTPLGNPVAFRCDFPSGVVSDYRCHTTIALSQDLGVGISEIRSASIPREKLMDLYRYALAEQAKFVINDADIKQ